MRSSSAKLPTYGTGWVAPTLPDWRVEESKIGSGGGHWPWTDEWNADFYIDKYKNGDCKVCVVNASNSPIQGATITAQLTQHAFHFETLMESQLMYGPQYNATYVSKITDGTWNGFRYGAALVSGAWEGYTQEAWSGIQNLDKAWTLQITPRVLAMYPWRVMSGHVMIYARQLVQPNPPYGATDAEKLQYMRQYHIPDKAVSMQNYVTSWELTNEISSYGEYGGGNATAAASDPALMADGMLGWTLSGKRDCWINDYQNFDLLRIQAESFRAYGVPVKALGIQFYLNGAGSYQTYANGLAGLNENSSGGKAPWNCMISEISNGGSDSDQGIAETNALKAAMANPACFSYCNWGMWDPVTYPNNGGYYDTNWNEKPRLTAFKALVHGTWKTSASGTTSSLGTYQFRGFFGSYTISATVGGITQTRQIELHPGMRELVFVF